MNFRSNEKMNLMPCLSVLIRVFKRQNRQLFGPEFFANPCIMQMRALSILALCLSVHLYWNTRFLNQFILLALIFSQETCVNSWSLSTSKLCSFSVLDCFILHNFDNNCPEMKKRAPIQCYRCILSTSPKDTLYSVMYLHIPYREEHPPPPLSFLVHFSIDP